MDNTFHNRLASLAQRGYQPGVFGELDRLKSDIEAVLPSGVAAPDEVDIERSRLVVAHLTASAIRLPEGEVPDSLRVIARIPEGRIWSQNVLDELEAAVISALRDADERVARLEQARAHLAEVREKERVLHTFLELLDILSKGRNSENTKLQEAN